MLAQVGGESRHRTHSPEGGWGYSASLALGSRLSRCSGRGSGLTGEGRAVGLEGEFCASLASHLTLSPRTQEMKPQERSREVGLPSPWPSAGAVHWSRCGPSFEGLFLGPGEVLSSSFRGVPCWRPA